MVQPFEKKNMARAAAGIHADVTGVTMIEIMVVIVLTVIFLGLAFAAMIEINEAWAGLSDNVRIEKEARDALAEISRSLRSIDKNSTLVTVSNTRQVGGIDFPNDRIEFKSQTLGEEEVTDRQYYLAVEEGEMLGLKSRGAIISESAVGLGFEFYSNGKWEESWKAEGLPSSVRITLLMDGNPKPVGRRTMVSLPVAN